MNIVSNSQTAAIVSTAFLLCGCLTVGCRTHHGADASGPNTVDNSWVSAAKSCWPDIASQAQSPNQIQQYLSGPANFRATFPTYSGSTDAALRMLLTEPVGVAPLPDIGRLAHSSSPVLTRGQAAAGTGPHGAIVASTNGIAPPDALCAIQPGIPAGFR